MSAPAADPAIRRRELVLAGIAALIAFVVPLSVVSWLDDPEPEIRVLASSERLSALVIDGDARVLIANSDDREEAGAMLGRIAQPWEPEPRTIVAPPDEGGSLSLWEALQRLEPATVVVAGIPGADPLWAAIESECNRRNIDLRYVSDRATLSTEHLDLTVFGTPPEAEGATGVVIRRGEISVVAAFGSIPPPVPGQVLIFNGDPSSTTPDLLVSSDDAPHSVQHNELLVTGRRYTRLVLTTDDVHVFGGTLRLPQSPNQSVAPTDCGNCPDQRTVPQFGQIVTPGARTAWQVRQRS
ncbi:MAG TPA: hypothetical protein VFV93_10665 [Thermomicrobiales bacterium]|nr:hypothetical protein [Thermomicrobiales bacterium]